MLIVEGVTVIDAAHESPLPDASIVVEGTRIREVSQGLSSLRDLDGVEVIDARGKYALPGLMDMHTHLCMSMTSWNAGADDPSDTQQTVAGAAVTAVQNARGFVERGITTVRDCGSRSRAIFAITALIDSGAITGPRVVPCGRAINVTGGPGMVVSGVADGPDEVRRFARHEIRAGAKALKFMASGPGAMGDQGPLEVTFTQEEIAAGVREMQVRGGGTTCAHSMNPESTRNAVLAGVNSIEHGLLLDEPSLQLMLEHDVAYVPTVWTYMNTAERGADYGVESATITEVRSRVETHHRNVARAHELGLRICAGTDSGLPLNLSDSLFWELEWLTYCGLSPFEAIVAATANPAYLLRRSSDLGTLEAGKIADLVVVDGDPLEDIRNLKRTSVVLMDGVPVVAKGRLRHQAVVSDLRSLEPGPTPPPSWLAAV